MSTFGQSACSHSTRPTTLEMFPWVTWQSFAWGTFFGQPEEAPYMTANPQSCHSQACVKALSRLYRWRGVWLDEMMLLQCAWQWKSFWTYRTHQCIFSSQLLGFSARYHVVSLYLKIKIENEEMNELKLDQSINTCGKIKLKRIKITNNWNTVLHVTWLMRDTFLYVRNWKYTNNVKFRKRRQQQGHVHKLTTELCKSINQQYSI